MIGINPFESVEARRRFLAQEERLRQLSVVDRDLVRLGQMPDLARWLEQVAATGGCARPVYVAGRSTVVDGATGEVVREYSTAVEPGGRLALRCRNRRATVCEPCSRLYQGDAWQVVKAGLVGGKGVAPSVREHPAVFLTLTAPSFGEVHRAGRCVRVREGSCEHGAPLGCGRRHREDSGLVGQPLCAGCYDYTGHVLWHAHAGRLWSLFVDALYYRLGVAGGLGKSAVRRALRVSAVKVAEFQKRGAVHFHAVVRLDGPQGPEAVGPAAADGGTTGPASLENEPPEWASIGVLLAAVRSAAVAARVRVVSSDAYAVPALKFGDQVEVHPIAGAGVATDERVAAYLAKYTTKSTDGSGALDHRITSGRQVQFLPVSGHVRALVGMAWRLGGLAELAHLRLRLWAHALGFRGHCLTKTRAYSVTFKRLRADRAAYGGTRRLGPGELIIGEWRFVRAGHSPGEAQVAAQIAWEGQRARELARDYRVLGWVGGWGTAGTRAG
ncbi:replication initiator [Kitasatospora viridis]|uniref:Plasmid replication initiator protein n=1 Tax=Kitasatospora viridis TaxID=281105 RepID=A0A561TTD1_9ACTN|nr:replication initiator [Kitasatospora viridis]TWF90372.1 hypothetical protein FHX73_13416 [Kitasatospora viridis]